LTGLRRETPQSKRLFCGETRRGRESERADCAETNVTVNGSERFTVPDVVIEGD
jgi:hypothetical protein